MFQGIPLPPGFDPAKISNQDLTTNRYEVGSRSAAALPANGSVNGAKHGAMVMPSSPKKQNGHWPAPASGRSFAR
jgi:hypothetical protein